MVAPWEVESWNVTERARSGEPALPPADAPVPAELPACLVEGPEVAEPERLVQCDRCGVGERDAGVRAVHVLCCEQVEEARVQPPADPPALAKTIQELLEDDTKRNRLALNGYRLV